LFQVEAQFAAEGSNGAKDAAAEQQGEQRNGGGGETAAARHLISFPATQAQDSQTVISPVC
jgi:hypothetical protein